MSNNNCKQFFEHLKNCDKGCGDLAWCDKCNKIKNTSLEKHCDKCKKCVHIEYEHCDNCGYCSDKEFQEFLHCLRCGKCLDNSFQKIYCEECSKKIS